MARPFLTAEWRYLAMLNFAVDPAVLLPLVPAGTGLDHWQGITFVSLVGFLFADTRILGVPVPFHRTFEEVNLRFYVRRRTEAGDRRGVTFVRELVPRAAIATVARLAYNEPYRTMPMRHLHEGLFPSDTPGRVEYEWREPAGWSGIQVIARGAAQLASPGSEEEFITEHYWGYTRQRDGSTLEYQVTHPPWRVWATNAAMVTGDLAAIYGPVFAAALRGAPTSAFLAEGSAVTVWRPSHLATDRKIS